MALAGTDNPRAGPAGRPPAGNQIHQTLPEAPRTKGLTQKQRHVL